MYEIDEKLRRDLLEMARRDQAMQQDLKANPLGPGRHERIAATFRENNRRLHAIFRRFGWPGEALAGKDGSNAAWLLVQHADEDKSLQRLALQKLETAVRKGEASRPNLAYLTDRVRVNAGQKQVYGTQLDWPDADHPRPKPTEDMPNLNKRRASMGLEPIEEYLKFTLEAMRELRKKLQPQKGG
jgi:hypothetical protein